MSEILLQEVKEEIKVTWADEDDSIERMIVRAKGDLESLVGVSLDLDTNTRAKTLFLNYCRYDYNNALEYFEDNFHKEILWLQYSEGVKDDVKEEG